MKRLCLQKPKNESQITMKASSHPTIIMQLETLFLKGRFLQYLMLKSIKIESITLHFFAIIKLIIYHGQVNLICKRQAL